MGQCSLFVRRPQLAPVVRTGEQWPHGPTEAVCVRGAGGGAEAKLRGTARAAPAPAASVFRNGLVCSADQSLTGCSSNGPL